MNSFHQAYSTLRAPTVRRVFKMGGYAVVFTFILSIGFALFAYFSIGQDLLNINLYPDRPPLSGSSDIANKILKISKLIVYHQF